MENRIMVQLSFAGSTYRRVAEIYRILDTLGLDVTILPKVDRGKPAVLIIPRQDVVGARGAFDLLGIRARETEVLVLHLENRMGAIADISRRIGDGGVSIKYASLGRLSISEAYLILECSDNKLALAALDAKPANNPAPIKALFL